MSLWRRGVSDRSTSVNISMGLGWVALVVLILSGVYEWDIRCAWFRIKASCDAAEKWAQHELERTEKGWSKAP